MSDTWGLAKVVRKVEFKLYTSLDRLEECPEIPQPFDPIFPATTLGVLHGRLAEEDSSNSMDSSVARLTSMTPRKIVMCGKKQ